MTSKERFWKTVALEEPDRVPVSPYIVYLAATLAGMAPTEFGWSVDKSHQALFEVYKHFYKAIDALQITCMRFAYTSIFPSAYSALYFDWEFPEQGLPQFIERGQNYGPEIYDRVLEEGFASLISPERIDVDKIKATYTSEAQKHRAWLKKWGEEDVVNLATGPMATIPADLLVYARGGEGFLDLALYPEKIKAVNDAMCPGMIAASRYAARDKKGKEYFYRVSVQNFNADMISPQMFEELCWPWMKNMILAFLEDDCSLIIHLDGKWTPFYRFFQDLPSGRIIMELEFSDMKEAKKILGHNLCLKGNVPCTDLAFGTTSDVRDQCKRLIDDCAAGGGFILSSGCEAPVDTKPQNIEAMIDTAITYGKY
jgi:Uroporphyrinogen decarboxylase (URO-D)